MTSRSTKDNRNGVGKWWQTDLEDMEAVRRLIQLIKPDIIFHFSGLTSGRQDIDILLPTFHSLLTSTINLLKAVTETGCSRIILPGSLNEPQGNPSSAIPSSPYAAAKWASSGYARMFHALYGTPTVIVRTFMTFGPGQNTQKLIPSVILSLLNHESPMLSSGRWEADWIYIDDVVEGFLAAAQVPEIEGSTLDLGSGTLITVRDLVEGLMKIIDGPVQPQFGVLPDRVSEPVLRAEIDHSHEVLGWRPKISLEHGLQRTVEWYKAQHFSVRPTSSESSQR